MPTSSEQESRKVAEESREAAWRGSSFLREVFLGRFRPALLPERAFESSTRPEFLQFYEALHETVAHGIADDDLLRDMWSNDDAAKHELAKSVLDGEQVWLERGTMGLPYETEQLRPETMAQYFAARERERTANPPQISRTGS